ncbi:HAD family hydrolase [Pedobacter polysacchareus]|uniref:HAD family hydrolase n=1 Tax=Pedobacter polysacchareus TaxID=2861973 RepID=UPI001C9984E7|nr:HAD hydrolase-like protein [Pedobacter polysacchareus]
MVNRDTIDLKFIAESFHKAAALLGCDCTGIYSIGDRAIDIQASQAAGITSVACIWGNNVAELLSISKPTNIIHHPKEILPY